MIIRNGGGLGSFNATIPCVLEGDSVAVADVMASQRKAMSGGGYVGVALISQSSPLARLVLIYLGTECDDDGCLSRFDAPTFAQYVRILGPDMEDALSELHGRGLIYRSEFGIIVLPETLEEPLCENLLLAAWFKVQETKWRDRPPSLPSKAELKRRALISFGHRCVYCERLGTLVDPDGQTWELDRINPGKNGGGYLADNVALTFRACNRDKRAHLDWAGPTLSLADLEAVAGEGATQ